MAPQEQREIFVERGQINAKLRFTQSTTCRRIVHTKSVKRSLRSSPTSARKDPPRLNRSRATSPVLRFEESSQVGIVEDRFALVISPARGRRRSARADRCDGGARRRRVGLANKRKRNWRRP